MVAWEGDFWGDFDLSRGFYDRYERDCQDMDFFVWDGSIEVIYTISILNLSPPPICYSVRLIWCGGGVVAALGVYIGIFLPIDELSSI